MGVEEDRIPIDSSGRPDLTHYKYDANYYAAMHASSLQLGGIYSERVHGSWGLIANGKDAIPFALAMLAGPDSEAREDGAGILGAIGKGNDVVVLLIDRLAVETDTEARDSLIQALGGLRNRLAIPALAALIEDDATDGDTCWTAIESLGCICRRRFLDKPDPVMTAREWLVHYKSRKQRI